jgi:hypothetical protein
MSAPACYTQPNGMQRVPRNDATYVVPSRGHVVGIQRATDATKQPHIAATAAATPDACVAASCSLHKLVHTSRESHVHKRLKYSSRRQELRNSRGSFNLKPVPTVGAASTRPQVDVSGDEDNGWKPATVTVCSTSDRLRNCAQRLAGIERHG